MHRGNANVEGVFERFRGDQALCNQVFGKLNGLFRDSKHIQPFDCPKPLRGGIGIARRAFPPDNLGNKEIIGNPLIPPQLCKLLMGSAQDCFARTGCQIADDGSLYINCAFHYD